MPLSKIDKEYLLPLISPMDAKTIEIDRAFTNFLPLLKHDGAQLARAHAELITILALTNAITRNDTLHFQGFAEHAQITSAWLESDFLSLVKRGDPDKQKIAAPVPMHLNTYKLRNPAHCRDYGTSMQFFSLLSFGNRNVLQGLRDFMGKGADFETDQYDAHTPLDIETMLMIRILDQQRPDFPDRRKTTQIPVPVCLGQAKLLCDDIERLLEYQYVIPRLVLIGYIKNVMSLHLGIYVLRLFQIIPNLMKSGRHDTNCENCRFAPSNNFAYQQCLNPVQLIVDMGENYRTPMAELARQQFERHLEQLNIYVRSHLMLKKLHEFGESLQQDGHLAADGLSTLEQVVALRNYPDQVEFKTFFKYRVRRLMETEDQERDERLTAIQKLGLDDFDTYVEMLHLLRQRFHQKYYVEMLDSFFQKNSENALLKQGVGKTRNKRRYAMGSGLLETLVQLAVLQRAPQGGFRTQHIRVDEFLDWLEMRYGIYISRLPQGMPPSITELEALRLNVQSFKQRLREIGFYTDLSDSYVAQVIRPRYTLEARESI